MKPIIGITVDSKPDPRNNRTRGNLQLNWNYPQVICDAGGVPILIPPTADMEEVARIIDGWVIPGGGDMDANLWGEENHPMVKPVEKARFESEVKLFHAADDQMPVLSICYGCQFLNVVRGGSLIQHLPDEIGHDKNSGGTLQHYCLDPASKLGAAASADAMSGQSWHHQAIRTLGENLKVVATGDDGVIEGIEATDRPWVVGVQWHPERTMDDEATKRLFRTFVEQCAERARTKRKG
jgi:putative glutamine amidotransferase